MLDLMELFIIIHGKQPTRQEQEYTQTEQISREIIIQIHQEQDIQTSAQIQIQMDSVIRLITLQLLHLARLDQPAD